MSRCVRVALVVVCCGGCTDNGAIVVGSKNFTEQNVLAEIVAQSLEAEGLDVDRRFFLGGTFVCHRALVEGDIDVYVEYTGTALGAVLELPTSASREAAYNTVRSVYAEKWDLLWLPSLGFENTFALVVRRSDAERFDLRTISDLAGVADRVVAGFGPEFMARADGYPGLRAAYGLEFGQIRQLDLGLMYRALIDEEIDVAVANSTDGQIIGLDLVVLEDDRSYFPPYEAAPVLRTAIARERPEARDAIQTLAGRLDAETMRRLNYQVDVEGTSVDIVAAEFLRNEGLQK